VDTQTDRVDTQTELENYFEILEKVKGAQIRPRKGVLDIGYWWDPNPGHDLIVGP